ncbi:MAG: hypothetical protein ABIH65_03095 [Nanoarchaeota archaeon]
MKILFICKYNRFRSKFAEAYFKSKNKNKGIKVASTAIIKMDVPLTKEEKRRNLYLKKKFGISFDIVSRGISSKLLQKSDKIILVANDVPKKLFNGRLWRNKIEVWNVPDVKDANKRNIDKSVRIIINKVNNLLNKLK